MEFNKFQMEEIRLGLEAGLDTNVYADPKFGDDQMAQIREGLLAGLDVTSYANPELDYYQMREIRLGLEDGIDVTIYAVPKFDEWQMREIRYGLKTGVDVSKYADPKFNSDQMSEIRLGLEAEVDVMIYANPKFTSGQMEEIREGLEAGVDVSKYADTNLNWRQMSEIRLGLEAGVDATTYAKPELDDEQMGAIRKQLIEQQKAEEKSIYVLTANNASRVFNNEDALVEAINSLEAQGITPMDMEVTRVGSDSVFEFGELKYEAIVLDLGDDGDKAVLGTNEASEASSLRQIEGMKMAVVKNGYFFKKQLAYLEALSFNSETLEELTNIRPEPLMAEGTTWARIHPLFVKRGQKIYIDGIYLEEKDSVNVHSKFTAYLVPFDFTVTYREALNYNTHKRPVPIIKEEQNFVEELHKFADVIVTN